MSSASSTPIPSKDLISSITLLMSPPSLAHSLNHKSKSSRYSDSDDCAKFYICLNGISPREQGCELGLVYNELSKQCDAPENVPECKDYYAFLEDGDQAAKKRK